MSETQYAEDSQYAQNLGIDAEPTPDRPDVDHMRGGDRGEAAPAPPGQGLRAADVQANHDARDNEVSPALQELPPPEQQQAPLGLSDPARCPEPRVCEQPEHSVNAPQQQGGRVGWTKRPWKDPKYNNTTHEVDQRGRLKGEAGFNEDLAILRVPISELKSVGSAHALAFVGRGLVKEPAQIQNQPLDVMVYWHGSGAFSEAKDNGTKSKRRGSEVGEDDKRVNDLHVSQVPQQMAASGQRMVGIGVQWRAANKDKHVDNIVEEVFAVLRKAGHLTAQHKPGRAIIAAHSAGAQHGLARAGEAAAGGRFDEGGGMFLFDPYFGKPSDYQKNPQWKKLGKFIIERLKHDHQQLDGKPHAECVTYLNTKGFVFRIYVKEGSPYLKPTKALEADVNAFFGSVSPKLSCDAEWRANYHFNYFPFKELDLHENHGGRVSSHDDHGQNERGVWSRDYHPDGGDYQEGNLENALDHFGERGA